MTLSINQLLFSSEIRKYPSFAEMNIAKAPRRIETLVRGKSWFEDWWENLHNTDYMNLWKEDFRRSGRTFEKVVNLLCLSLEKQIHIFGRFLH